MLPYRSKLAAAALAYSSLVACALEDGRPWGTADVILEAEFAPEPSRTTADGRVATSADYAVRVDSLAIAFDLVAIRMQDGGGASRFDPANPPPGYSLCHSGHCHKDTGELVDYEDIERELAGQQGSQGPSLSFIPAPGPIRLSQAPSAIEIESCSSEDCSLPRGVVQSVSVVVHELILSGHVVDRRVGSESRLSSEGLSFSGGLELEEELSENVAAEIDSREPEGLRLRVRLELTDKLFDRIDFAALTSSPNNSYEFTNASTVAESLRTNFQKSSLTVTTERFDPR